MPDPKKLRNSASGLQHRCVYCQIKFKPHSRLGKRQKNCGASLCRKKHRSSYQRKDRKVPENAQAEQEYEKDRKSKREPGGTGLLTGNPTQRRANGIEP